MIEQQVFGIVFSIILLPVNLFCAFWLLGEALNLTGMTFEKIVEKSASKTLTIGVGRHRQRKLQLFLVNFFNENSSDPKKSIRLTKIFAICMLPGFVSLGFAVCSAININSLKYVFIGNITLVVINMAIFILGRIYKKRKSIDDIAEKKSYKDRERKERTKIIIVYSVTGTLLFGVLLFFMLGISGISQSYQNTDHHQNILWSAISIRADLIEILNEKGYVTSNVSTTYWEFDEDKLEHVAAGIKDGSKFEFYGYSDDKTVDSVYNKIVYLISLKTENSERKNDKNSYPDRNKMFTAVIDDIYYLVTYQKDTLIYAYSHDSLNEINEVLTRIGYI